jgi:hypothetical protein
MLSPKNKGKRGIVMAKEMTIKEAGKRGGQARARNLSKKEKSAIARQGAKARWAKSKKKGESK